MSINVKNGVYYYRLQINGQRHCGTCLECRTRQQAIAFEKRRKAELLEESSQADKVKYLEQRIIAVQGGNAIPLSAAAPMALAKPNMRQTLPKTILQYTNYWNDFIAYAGEVLNLDILQQVKKSHAESYISFIRDNGRYRKTIEYMRNGVKVASTHLSPMLSNATKNKIHMACKLIFDQLQDESGLIKNPFDFDKIENDAIQREIFSGDEIKCIIGGEDSFVVPIMRMALYSGLRLGDVCSLTWHNIDFNNGFISLKMNKTAKQVVVPILDHDYLGDLYNHRESDFVFPRQREMYLTNPTGLSYRIKKFLNSLGIHTARERESGHRQSVKDFHSCRHTFATICAERGIPLTTVQNALGHTSSEITEIYTSHLRKAHLKEEFKKFTLSDQKNTRHGLNTIFKLSVCLINMPHQPRETVQKIAYTICENLDKENLKMIFDSCHITTLLPAMEEKHESNDDSEFSAFMTEQNILE